jgi:hypothetical protein
MPREVVRIAEAELTGIGIGSTGWLFPSPENLAMWIFFRWKGCNPVKDPRRAFGAGGWKMMEMLQALGAAAWARAEEANRG